MKSPIEIEQEIDVFFRSINFERVSEYVGKSPEFANADYVDQSRKIIVELKVLDKDYFVDGGFINILHSFVPKPVEVNKEGIGLYTIKMPQGKRDTFEEPLRRLIKKANRQIRETKNYLFCGDGLGFIMIALSEFKSLHLDALTEMICNILCEGFSSISGVIICTPTWINPSCISATIHNNAEIHSIRFEIAEAWSRFVDTGGHSSG